MFKKECWIFNCYCMREDGDCDRCDDLNNIDILKILKLSINEIDVEDGWHDNLLYKKSLKGGE